MNRSYRPSNVPHYNNYKNHSLLYQMTNATSAAKTHAAHGSAKKVHRPSVSTVSSNHENSVNNSTCDATDSCQFAKVEAQASQNTLFSNKQQVQLAKYKTELCKNLVVNGACKYGDNCFFAHCKEELQSRVPYNHYYKTKICKHYNNTGFCPYANRCQYFHVKSNQLYNELLDSFEKKVALRMTEEENRLELILDSTERVQKRLAVFKRLANGDDSLSFQEKCLENHF